MNAERLRRFVDRDMSRTIEDLKTLVRIPSISQSGFDPAGVRRSAGATADILRASGFGGVRLLELDGGHPAVFGEIEGSDGSPTLLLYAHHDVQPAGPIDAWSSDPFEPEVRDGRIYGRGTSDNKNGIVTHAAALRAVVACKEEPPPISVKIVVEGEEESSTEHLGNLISGHRNLLEADVAIVADGGNYRTHLPTLEVSLRGIADCLVTVRALDVAQHSGVFGGPIPDALTALSRMVASLHDDVGDVAVEGLRSSTWSGFSVPEEDVRSASTILDSVRLIGTGSVSERLMSKPAISILGIDAPTVAESSHQIVPEARARISMAIAPNEAPDRAFAALRAHLVEAAPWGVDVEVEPGLTGRGFAADSSTETYGAARRALATAFGEEPIEIGSGGTIPFVPALVEVFPNIEVIMWGSYDDRANLHSIDESLDLADLQSIVLAESLFMCELAST